MRLLDRYLLRELLIPLISCLGGFTIFWVAFDLFSSLGDFQERKLKGLDVLQYYLVAAPEFFVFVLPIALLLALLYTLTNLSRHHEMVAMRAAGQSLWRLSMPYLAVGLLISLASFAINELWAPRSADAAERILNRNKPAALRANQVANWGFDNTAAGRHWSMLLYDFGTGVMRKPEVFWTNSDGAQLWLRAESARYTNHCWDFFSVSEYRVVDSFPTPVLRTNELVMTNFRETPEEIRSEYRIRSSIALPSNKRAKKADIPISEILSYRRLHPKPEDRPWLDTKLQGRLAAPWTCLVVVLIAIPFGAGTGRRNVFLGVAGSIFICFGFFILQQLGLALGSGGYVPGWVGAWFPNLSVGLAGIWLTSRVR